MSNINNYRVNMKGKLTAIIAGTMLVVTGATLGGLQKGLGCR